MKIIDSKTGKRIVDVDKELNKKISKADPVKRNVEKGLENEEYSPMDPPEAYDATIISDISYDQMDGFIKKYMDEHKVCIEKLDAFEKALVSFKESNYKLSTEINSVFGDFFDFFDNNLLDHNQREEKQLFPLLHKRLIESGESAEGENPNTAVDMMEDDHIKFIQLGTLTFNLLGLATRLQDDRSRIFTYDVAYNNGRELVELLRLHIFREDNILFPLAQKLISKEEFSTLAN
ncbi:MAG: hypothetical protein DWP98_13140 [Bacteroidetes bacterium]|nr:MAG: hypothetical protein DWP98_13140 [Bacteroidota bacterium]MBL1145761.1 hypothetical protein [Bacteroidota bacterium]MCB0803909.1 hemerythrin domain-containing protein [Flavobacteriales bacterium]NOG58555.1 hemerythrin domain-containing protein [Bacteroidota bacterium]